MPIISLHSIDAGGKATQTRAIVEKLVAAPWAAGFVISSFDFPRYQSTMGGIIGRVLRGETLVVPDAALDEFTHQVHFELAAEGRDELKKSWSLDKAHLIQAAMLVNRLEHLNMLRLGSRTDRLLILDRYSLDAIVYGQVDGISRDWLLDVHEALPPAMLNIVLDITVEESVRRRPERRDYYEKNVEKLAKVRQLYLDEVRLHSEDPTALYMGDDGPIYNQYFTLNGQQPVDAITADILQMIRTMIDQLPAILT